MTSLAPMVSAPPPRNGGRYILWVLSALVALAFTPGTAAAQIAVVVNAANPVDDLSMDRLKRIFLGQASTFSSGARARIATHTGSADAFDRSALGLQPDIVRSRWMAIVFRGEATAVPISFASVDDVKKFVQEHPDAIAYLPVGAVDGSLKVLRIDGRRPTDPGYPIR